MPKSTHKNFFAVKNIKIDKKIGWKSRMLTIRYENLDEEAKFG
jgi:hypothetical protein